MKNADDFYQPRSDYRHSKSLYKDSEMGNTHPVEQITGFVVQSAEDRRVPGEPRREMGIWDRKGHH